MDELFFFMEQSYLYASIKSSVRANFLNKEAPSLREYMPGRCHVAAVVYTRNFFILIRIPRVCSFALHVGIKSMGISGHFNIS